MRAPSRVLGTLVAVLLAGSTLVSCGDDDTSSTERADAAQDGNGNSADSGGDLGAADGEEAVPLDGVIAFALSTPVHVSALID